MALRLTDPTHNASDAELALRRGVEPAAELLLHLVSGMLNIAQGRYEEAMEAFRVAERQQSLLIAPHALSVVTRGGTRAAQLPLLGRLAASDASS